MTSSNVSKLLIQVSQIDLSAVADKTNVSKDKGLFENTLKNVAGVSAPVEASKVETSKAKVEDKSFEPTAKNTVMDDRSETTDVGDKAQLVEKIENFAQEIKDDIKEELGVSEEEFEEAMAALSLSLMDLFDPQNLAQLVVELTDQTDSLSLLTDVEFKNILDSVVDITNQLFEELDISLTDLKELSVPEEMEPTEIEIPVENLNSEIPVEQTNAVDEILVTEGEDKTILLQPELKPQEKPQVTEEVKVEEKEIVDEKPVEMKPELENENQSSKQQFDFTKDNKSQTDMPKVHHEVEAKGEAIPFVGQQHQIQFSVEQEVVTLPTGETVRADNIVNQLVEQARVLSDTESTTLEMTLNPEGLGKIYMEVTQKGNEITAKIFTENDAVKQALENQMATLRLELNNSSTKVTSIEVSVGTHEFERNLEQNAQDESRREEQAKQAPKRSNRIDINSLDDLSGLMSEEDILIAQMMRDNGNTLDFQA